MYKFIGKHGQMYKFNTNLIKLNYKCKTDEFEAGTNKCSNGENNNIKVIKSINELHSIIDKKYGFINTDLKGATPTLANKVYHSLDSFCIDYPTVSENINSLTVSEIKDSPYAQTTDDGDITLDKNWFQKSNVLISSLKEDCESGFHVIGGDSVEAMITHELGHVLLGWMKENVDGFDNWLSKNEKELSKVSKYASVDNHEAFAEAFCSMQYTPVDKQLPIIKQFKEYLQNNIKR